MTKRQAHTLVGLGITLILTQILCTAVLVCKMESTRKSARRAEAWTEAAMEYSKWLENRNATDSTAGRNVKGTIRVEWGRNVGSMSVSDYRFGLEPDSVTEDAH